MMNNKKIYFLCLFFILSLGVSGLHAQHQNRPDQRKIVHKQADESALMIRIAEIDILPEYLEKYKLILKEEAAASVTLEPGVIAIFPMHQQKSATQIMIVEIYANKAAYESHLETPHFKHYKLSTENMVRSLKLIDMESIDKEVMPQIFKKLTVH